jgi:hypothetical protein
MSGFGCIKGYDCTQMFGALGQNNEPAGTIQQPDGETCKRIEFVVYSNDLDFENMELNQPIKKDLGTSGGIFFMIDPSNPSDNYNIYGQLLRGNIEIQRTSQSAWSIVCKAEEIFLKELEAQTQSVCRGKKCTNMVFFKEVAYGTAGPMAFNLTFTRSAH